MAASARLLLVGMVAALMVACSHTVTGGATRSAPGLNDDPHSPVDVESVLLEQSQMRSITGAGEHLTIIPSMDGKLMVDIDQLAKAVPDRCRWYFAETQTFGSKVEEFHKTTYQNPPDRGLISQGAAGYRDRATARGAFDALVREVTDCESTADGAIFVGDLTSDTDSLSLRTGDCGRDYRVKSAVLVEVTFCRFPPSVPDIVMTNMLAHIPN